MKIKVEKFGVTKDNEEVLMYTVEGLKIKAEFLNYGCTIKSIYTPDKLGIMENIVLGFENFSDYDKKNPSFFGCVVGRIAGRTKNGMLDINGDIYELTKNDGNSNLHGGINALHNRVWKSSSELVDGKAIITFKTKSLHLEEGFPGDVDFTVKYIIDNDSIRLEYLGVPDRETYMNLTNHVFFNLSGNRKRDILNQEYNFNALGYYAVDEEILPVELVEKDEIFESGKNFTLGRALESGHEQISIVGKGYDHPFVLSKAEEIDGFAEDKKSGRRVEFVTDQPVVVLYSGNFVDTVSNYGKYAGFCLETQDYADIKSIEPEKMKIYSTNKVYSQKTTYFFKTI